MLSDQGLYLSCWQRLKGSIIWALDVIWRGIIKRIKIFVWNLSNRLGIWLLCFWVHNRFGLLGLLIDHVKVFEWYPRIINNKSLKQQERCQRIDE
jgi:hypothetical protein